MANSNYDLPNGNYLRSVNISHNNKKLSDILNSIEIDKYSTSEVKTNEIWIDNKPIYRKIYKLNVSTNLQITQSLSSLNYDTIFVDVSHSFFSTSANLLPLGHFGDVTDFSRTWIDLNSKLLYLLFGSVYSSFSKTAYVTLLYTKK